VHCNNCTSDINAWVKLIRESLNEFGFTVDTNTLYTKLFEAALKGDDDCGGLLSYNYFSGEGVTDVDEGRPVFLRLPDAKITLPNFMRTHLLSALATLKIGLDLLTDKENICIDKLYGHGGFFKTAEAGQRMLSAAVGAPVSVMQTANNGGPYGMALLAAYCLNRKDSQTLEDYLENEVFADVQSVTLMADDSDIAGFDKFLERYKTAFPVEKAAISFLH
jgi:sugar (pentulose or hexulose) kinase